MTMRAAITLGMSTLVLGGAVAAGLNGAAQAGSRDAAQDAREAAKSAAKARKAIDKNQGVKAVAFAEAAVRLAPTDAAYRALLGQSYLAAGRFTSAKQALTDALTLDPENGRAALSLALATVALGDWAGARAVLDTHASRIPVGDLGMAIALAGDPGRAVDLLLPAARASGSDAKTRQNLALSLALAGRWSDARLVAAVDLKPDAVNARMAEWASFAQPQQASDQVAALLGVTPVADDGQPAALALAASAPALAAKPSEPIEAYLPGAPTAEALVAAAEAAAASSETTAAPAAAAPASAEAFVAAASAAPATALVFAPRQEIVQRLPDGYQPAATSTVRLAVPAAKPYAPRAKVGRGVGPVAVAGAPVVTAPAATKGNWYVQLGAFDNAGVARVAWRRLSGNPLLGGHAPAGAGFNGRGGSFYRLSVGGFARAEAVALCQSLRARALRCFVRAEAGDQVANWARGVQVASR